MKPHPPTLLLRSGLTLDLDAEVRFWQDAINGRNPAWSFSLSTTSTAYLRSQLFAPRATRSHLTSLIRADITRFLRDPLLYATLRDTP